MGRLLLVLVTGLVCGCATTPEAAPPAPGETALAAQPPPESDVAQAWNAVEETPAQVSEAPPPPIDSRRKFRDLVAEGHRALTSGSLDEAGATGRSAVTAAAELGGDERHRAHELVFRVSAARADPAAASQAALEWHQACGPERLDTCRAGALRALASAARLKGAPPEFQKTAEALAKTDDCLMRAERAVRLSACFSDAERAASSRGDGVGRTRALLVRALTEANETKRTRLLERAASGCNRVQCAALRRRALGALLAMDLRVGDLEAALRHSLSDLQVHVETLPPEQRPWGRTPAFERVCTQYDAAFGPGSCRRAELEALGTLTWRDYSTRKSGQGLSAEVVREVNEHYNPSLEGCLNQEARRLRPPDAVRYQVRWLVLNDGRVGEVHLRKDLDDTELARCLRGQFPLWRYPRYEGEWQHVEQSYTVRATERRTMR